jgi:hypothetical protein
MGPLIDTTTNQPSSDLHQSIESVLHDLLGPRLIVNTFATPLVEFGS